MSQGSHLTGQGVQVQKFPALSVARASMLGTTLLIGVALWYLVEPRPAAEPMAGPARGLQIGVFALCAALAVYLWFSGRRIRAGKVAWTPDRSLRGWAVAEFAVFAGAIVTYLTGRWSPFGVGVLLLLLAFALLPVRLGPASP